MPHAGSRLSVSGSELPLVVEDDAPVRRAARRAPRRCRSARCRTSRPGARGGPAAALQVPLSGRDERPLHDRLERHLLLPLHPQAGVVHRHGQPVAEGDDAACLHGATSSRRGWTSTTEVRRSNTRRPAAPRPRTATAGEHHREEPDAPAPPAADHGSPYARRARPPRGRPPTARHTLPDVASQRPVGTITRGTTNPNRLRRVDRWLAGPQGWRLRAPAAAPVVVDLGYGASPVTAVELHDRLRRVRPDVEVVGIEIDPARVRGGAAAGAAGADASRSGGFEVPLPGGARPVVVRAFNVLRQYDEGEVAGAWATRARAPRARRPAGRRHLRRARPAQHLGGGDGRRPALAEPVAAPGRAASAPRTWPSGCPRR